MLCMTRRNTASAQWQTPNTFSHTIISQLSSKCDHSLEFNCNRTLISELKNKYLPTTGVFGCCRLIDFSIDRTFLVFQRKYLFLRRKDKFSSFTLDDTLRSLNTQLMYNLSVKLLATRCSRSTWKLLFCNVLVWNKSNLFFSYSVCSHHVWTWKSKQWVMSTWILWFNK